MVRYLKYIVLIFGTIGIITLSFFYLQNKEDISIVLDYKSKIDYEYLQKNCPEAEGKYYYPCLKPIFKEFLGKVSITGASMGMKMAFNVMDDDKDNTTAFASDDIKNFHYTINYLEINNMIIDSIHRRYHGFGSLYGGYIATLDRYYQNAFIFSNNLITGLEGDNGIEIISDEQEKTKLLERLNSAKEEFDKVKQIAEDRLEKEEKRLNAERKE